jgi:uncharacterized membrane protein YeaQ/YmgE (transglycosylase-associated protein family)
VPLEQNGGMFYVLGLLVLGLFVGAIARLIVHSPGRLGCLGTALLGIIGSYAGGTLGSVLFHDKFDLRKASTIVGAIAGSVVVLLIWRLFSPDNRRSRR